MLSKLPIIGWKCKPGKAMGGALFAPMLTVTVVFLLLIISSHLVQVYPQYQTLLYSAQLFFTAIGLYSLYSLRMCIKRTLLEPLSHMRDWANSMRSGNLSAQIPVVGQGEFALLAKDINDLGESLRSLSREMDGNVKEQTKRLEQKTNMLEILYDVAASSNTAPNSTELLRRNLSTLADILSAPYATVRLLTDDEQLKLIASKGFGGKVDSCEHMVPIERCLCAMNHSEELIECSGDKSFCGSLLAKTLKDRNMANVLAIPLRYQNRTLGIYNLFLSKKYNFDWEIDNLLVNIGRHLSLAIEKTKLDDDTKRITLIQERTMLAHELHDSLAQTLASLRFRVSLITRILRQEGNETALPDIIQLKNGLDEANNELRELLVHFRVHMDERGLLPAVENLIERFKSESGIAVFLQNEWADINLPPLHEVQVLHIIQESLANARKHSNAQHVRILMRSDIEGHYHVLIEDDGVGIETETIDGQPGEHVGLTIMQERARRIGGNITIESEPGDGTRVEMDFIYKPQQQDNSGSYSVNDKHLSTASGD